MRTAALFLATLGLLLFAINFANAHRSMIPRLFVMPARECYRGDGWTGTYVYCASESPFRPGGMGQTAFR